MTQKMQIEIAYQLTNDFDRFESFSDWKYDIELLSQDVLDELKYSGKLNSTEPLSLSVPIKMSGDVEILQYLDYPNVENGWSVMSKRMLQVLQSVKPFQARTYQLEIEDWIIHSERKLPNNTDFVAVQLCEYTDVFDYEKSVYKKSTYTVPRYNENGQEKWFVSDIKEYAFRVPQSGLPPVFRIKEDYGNRLFISHEARLALKEAKVTGVRYISLQGYRYGEISSEIDVPFTLPSEQERIRKAKTAHVLGVLR